MTFRNALAGLLLGWAIGHVVACSVPRLEDAGRVNEDGVCEILVVPGSCRDVADIERQFENALPCNTCVAYACDCQQRFFCKVCPPGGEPPPNAWGCTPGAPAWCIDSEAI